MHPRSSFALRFTDVGGGVIDADYRRRVSVIFFNLSNRFVKIVKIVMPTLREVDKFIAKRSGFFWLI